MSSMGCVLAARFKVPFAQARTHAAPGHHASSVSFAGAPVLVGRQRFLSTGPTQITTYLASSRRRLVYLHAWCGWRLLEFIQQEPVGCRPTVVVSQARRLININTDMPVC